MSKEITQAQLIRQLDRLKYFNSKNDPISSLSPFYHAALNLLKYSKCQPEISIKQKHFKQFYSEFQRFALSDFSNLVRNFYYAQKKNHQKILDEIAQITESKEFLKCLRPDIFNTKKLRSSLRKSKIEIIQIQTESYDFQNGKLDKYDDYGQKSTSSGFTVEQQEHITQKSIPNWHEEDLENQLQELYKSMKLSYQQHNLDDAQKKCNEYLSKIKNSKQLPQQKLNFIKTLNQQYELMTSFYSEFEKGQWEFDKQEDGITLQYKIYQEDGSIAIRINGEGDIPIEPFLSIISEVDLMQDYVPFCYGCKQEKKISRNERIGTSKVYMPLLCDRETYFYAAGYDRMKSHKSLFFFSKTINDDIHYQKKYGFTVPLESDFVRLVYDFFIIQYIPIGNNRAKIRLASKVDMKMNYIPKFILFKTARMFAFDYFKNIVDRIKNYEGSPWQKRVEKNPALYKFFHKKLDEYLLK